MTSLRNLGLALLSIALGCGSGSGSGVANLRVALTDSPVDEAQAVLVSIVRVEALRMGPEGEVRETVMDDPGVFDLLQLRNDVTAVLGEGSFPPGDYFGLRIFLAPSGPPANPGGAPPQGDSPHSIELAGERYPLFAPSAAQSGLKLQEDFTLEPDEITELVIDFNVRHSIVRRGRQHRYLLKPRLTLVPRVVSGAISGVVRDDSGAALADSTVSAQQAGEEAASVRTGADGGYRISPLRAGIYDLVVTHSGRAIGVATGVEVVAQQETGGRDFALAAVATGSLAGTAPIGDAFTIVLRFDGHFLAQAAPDPDTGAFAFDGLPEGSYDLNLLEDGAVVATLPGVAVTAGAETGGLLLAP